MFRPNKQDLGTFHLKVCQDSESRGIYVQYITTFSGPTLNIDTVGLRTWKQLLQDVHCSAEISPKLREN